MRKSENVRERLIEAGASLLAVKSYHNVGIQEIVTKACIPRGSFYYYFKSKEELGVAIINQQVESLKSIFKGTTFTPRERLWNYYKTRRDHHISCDCTSGCLIIKLTIEINELPPMMRASLREETDNWIALLEECIIEGQLLKEIDQTYDSRNLAEYLFSSWGGAVVRMQSTENVKPLDICLEYMFNKIFPAKKQQHN